ncbi:hypothetical protein [Parasitella parasitica]|uniref:Uncharacterized protein n=1 Tax=Parasitella parasitica TaxID=35722 RepID=A0A0B7NGT4_9FUNG|nr:hypothetical protein [Parasitella parasitica]
MSKNSAPTSSPSTSKAVDVIDLTQDNNESKDFAPPPTLKRKNEESTKKMRSGNSKAEDQAYQKKSIETTAVKIHFT